MAVHGLVWFVFAVSCVKSQANQFGGKVPIANKAVLLENLKSEINSLSSQHQLIVQEKLKTDQLIARAKSRCDSNVAKVLEQHQNLVNKASEDVKLMYQLHEKLKKEEELHILLETELKRLSEVLELYQNKYDVVFGDLNILNLRRQNGTSDRCKDVIQSLSTLNEGALNVRSGFLLKNSFGTFKRRLSNLDTQFKMQQSILNIRSIEKTKAVLALDSAKRILQSELDICTFKMKSANVLLEETKTAALTAEESKRRIEEDLKKSIDFSNAVKLEIKTGLQFINILRSKVTEMWKTSNTFKEDVACYKKIQSLD